MKNREMEMSLYDYIIVGGGIAGVSCTEQLYNYDDSCSILLISSSDFVKTVTNVQSMTKTLDSFDVEEKSASFLKQSCPSVRIEKSSIIKLDSKNQIVFTKKKKFRYKRLCICSGGVPKVIFSDNSNVLWIRDTESVKKFQERISNAKRIVIVGNGGIATEMVYELTDVDVIWAIKDKSLNATFVDAGAAEFMKPRLSKEVRKANAEQQEEVSKRRKYTVCSAKQLNTPPVLISTRDSNDGLGSALGPDWHSTLNLIGGERRGCKVTIETCVEVRRIGKKQEFDCQDNHSLQEEWPVYVELTNGAIYGCDFVVSATGVKPNTSAFLEGNDFKLGDDGGLWVDEWMRTSLDNVYAAGDVCSAGWELADHWFQFRLWTQARQMGSYAAKCMWAATKGEVIHMDFCFELFSHATTFFGHKVVLLGLFNGQKLDSNYEILLRMTEGLEYIKVVLVNGKMQGALLVGDTDMEETFENLILNQMDLTVYGDDLLNPDIDIEDYFD